MPPPAGLEEVVIRYCVVKFAVYILSETGVTIEWICAPLSFHEEKTYCIPVTPLWGMLLLSRELPQGSR